MTGIMAIDAMFLLVVASELIIGDRQTGKKQL